MTSVRFSARGGELVFSASGHASDGAAVSEVCAAVSALCHTLAQNVIFMRRGGKTESEPVIRLLPGDCEIRVVPAKEYLAEAIHAFLVIEAGFSLLAHNFGDKVSLTPFETEGEMN